MAQTGNVRWAEGLEQLMVPIDSVQQHPSNANNGDIDAITESIRVNGYNAPIIVERQTGYIVAGNHRWQALHGLGATEVPVIWTDMTPEQGSEIGLFGTGYTDESLQWLLESLANEAIPESEGMGQASMGLFQIVIDFDGMEDERDEILAEMIERFGDNARKVDL